MQYNQINTRCPFYRHAESLLGHREQRHVNIANRTGAGWSRWCPLRMRGWERSCRCRFCWGHPDRLWRYVLVVRNAPPGPDEAKIRASCFGWTCVGGAIAGVKWIDLVRNLTLVSAKSWLALLLLVRLKRFHIVVTIHFHVPLCYWHCWLNEIGLFHNNNYNQCRFQQHQEEDSTARSNNGSTTVLNNLRRCANRSFVNQLLCKVSIDAS